MKYESDTRYNNMSGKVYHLTGEIPTSSLPSHSTGNAGCTGIDEYVDCCPPGGAGDVRRERGYGPEYKDPFGQIYPQRPGWNVMFSTSLEPRKVAHLRRLHSIAPIGVKWAGSSDPSIRMTDRRAPCESWEAAAWNNVKCIPELLVSPAKAAGRMEPIF